MMVFDEFLPLIVTFPFVRLTTTPAQPPGQGETAPEFVRRCIRELVTSVHASAA